MTMSQGHFELIARVLSEAHREAREDERYDDVSTIEDIACMFAKELRATNERFDTTRFLRACEFAQ